MEAEKRPPKKKKSKKKQQTYEEEYEGQYEELESGSDMSPMGTSYSKSTGEFSPEAAAYGTEDPGAPASASDGSSTDAAAQIRGPTGEYFPATMGLNFGDRFYEGRPREEARSVDMTTLDEFVGEL